MKLEDLSEELQEEIQERWTHYGSCGCDGALDFGW